MRSQGARIEVASRSPRNLRKLLLDVLEQANAGGIGVGVGDRIRDARKEAGLTQPQLAALIGVQLRQVQYYESGESDPYRKLPDIAKATGKEITWFRSEGASPQAEDPELLSRLAAVEEKLEEVLRRLPAAPDGPTEAAEQ